jgi:fatty-acyl-CoA synthase
MPGENLAPAVLAKTIEIEEVTFAGAVPTIMQGLFDHYRATQTRPATLKRFITGGARCPERVIEEFEDVLGVEVAHAWGMTELSPVGTMNRPRRNPAWQSREERNAFKVRQGRPALGVDLRLLGHDGKPGRHDGETAGHLCVKGWAAIARYYGQDDTALDADGYFDTGDIATIDREGFMTITDRAKHLVKSGGEWISSQEIERHAVSHPAVAMAAVIGVPHHKCNSYSPTISGRGGDSGRDQGTSSGKNCDLVDARRDCVPQRVAAERDGQDRQEGAQGRAFTRSSIGSTDGDTREIETAGLTSASRRQV